MTKFKSEKAEKEAMGIIASMMVASARTAPKANGVDDVEMLVLNGDDLESLASVMDKIAAQRASPYPSEAFHMNADMVRQSSCVLLIGVRGRRRNIEKPLDCGACGYGTCENFQKAGRRKGNDFSGPTCILKALDLGIAIGSAVKLAGEFHVDNRIMYTIGVAAKRMQLLDADVIIGIPLSITGKNPYFPYYGLIPARVE
jgi:uncharacterized ferredoxin-like protein